MGTLDEQLYHAEATPNDPPAAIERTCDQPSPTHRGTRRYFLTQPSMHATHAHLALLITINRDLDLNTPVMQ